MYKSMYDKHECYTPEALQLDLRVNKAVKTILEEYVSQGYSIRELVHLAVNAVMDIEPLMIVEKQHRAARSSEAGALA